MLDSPLALHANKDWGIPGKHPKMIREINMYARTSIGINWIIKKGPSDRYLIIRVASFDLRMILTNNARPNGMHKNAKVPDTATNVNTFEELTIDETHTELHVLGVSIDPTQLDSVNNR